MLRAILKIRDRVRDLADNLPLGAAPLIILTLAAVAGIWLLFHPIEESTATLRLWTFTHIHSDAYKIIVPAFEARHPGVTVDIGLVHGDAVTSRLRAAFWSNLNVPDLVEVEISRAGSFFRGPVDEVGFEDLTPHLKAPGPGGGPSLYDRMVKTRLAPYTNRGRIFGMPHDVHPVMLAYRRDLFQELGIDPEKLVTWDDFLREGRRITVPGRRYMIHLSDSTAMYAEILLFQRDGGYFDAEGRLIMDNEAAVQTMLWYTRLVAGPNRIGSDPGFMGTAFAKALADGYILTTLCPDWRTRSIEKDMPHLAGKMALMPLPSVGPGSRRTSTWGGTMLGITRASRNKDLAWQLACHLYTDPEQLAARFRETNILPPFRDAWTQPAFSEPRPYWSGQPIGALFAALADDIPPQYTSPFIELAKGKLGAVVAACAAYYNSRGEDGFETFVRERLKAAAADVRRQMTRNPF